MNEKVRFSEEGGVLFAYLLSEIDHHTARPIREEIDKMLFKLRPDVLELNFSGVKFMDSSGIGLIIGRSEICHSLEAELRISSLSPNLLRVVRLSGIEKLRNLTIV